MAIKMQTSSLLRAFKLAPNRQSNWARHLNQSKSIRLRPRRVASTEPSLIGDQDKSKQQNGCDLGRVSINHVGVNDFDEAQLNEQRAQLPTTATTSGTQLPMISPEVEPKSHCNGQQKNHHLRRSKLMEEATSKTMQVERDAKGQCGGGGGGSCCCWQPSSAAVMLASVMVASIVCAANLIGPCNCDTLNGHNQFIASQVLVWQPNASGSSGHSEAGQVLQRSPARLHKTTNIERRRDDSMSKKEQLISSMAANVESQHFGGAKLANFRPVSTQTKATPNHDEFLRDILASHEIGRGGPTKLGPASSHNPQRLIQQSTGSKADVKLRQIMLMHEQAAATPSAGVSTKSQSVKLTSGADDGSNKATASGKWPAAIKSILPKELLTSSKASLMSIVPTQILSGRSQALLMKAAGAKSEAIQPDQHRDKSTPSASSDNFPFTQRASAKNYLMGSILGMGQMLLAQPKRSTTTESKRPGKAASEKTIYSKPANEFMPISNKPKNHKSSWSTSSSLQTERPKAEVEAVATSSESEQIASASGESSSSPTGWRQSTNEPNKPKVGVRKNWLVDDATNLAQAYIKDSFRDLLTLTQLPIFSGGPVSTAPSELEPGGKKWLANKLASEQHRGNKTNPIEDLLRYVYILGNVGVRRKRDPLKALGSHPHSRPLNVLAGTKPNKRPHLSLLAGAAAAAANVNRPTIGSLIKFRPSNNIAGSKLSSLLTANRDHIKSRGVMWDMATDPTLAVTMFHLIERASVALPLGFLLMPFVRMTRHPLGFDLGGILPARASHRSVDFEELAKRLDMDKILSRSMRSTHRNAPSFMG